MKSAFCADSLQIGTGRPCVVIAGSGMCAGGRVVNYLKAMLGDARNDVLFVGYQAAGTPGRDILTHGPRGGWVMLDGERHAIRAQIHQVGGYSAHAGQSDLLRFVAGIPRMPAEIRLVHGDDEAKAVLKRRLRDAGATRVLSPGAEQPNLEQTAYLKTSTTIAATPAPPNRNCRAPNATRLTPQSK